MKRILSLILVLMMVLPIFASCKKGSTEQPTSSTSSQKSSEKVSSSSSSSAKPSSSSQKPSSSSKEQSSSSSQVVSSSSSQTPSSSSQADSSSSSIDIGGGSQTTTSGFNYEDYREVTSDYNRNLFYYNELKFEVADPTVIYISDTNSTEYGYFYAYGTSDQIGCTGFQAWRSKDMTNWEDMGPVYLPDFNNNWAYTNYWAPEIIYDAQGMNIGGQTYKYFMFYNAEKYDANEDFVSGENRATTQHLSVLYAKEPNGPFIHPNGIKNSDGKSLSVTAPVFDFSKSNTAIASDIRCDNVIDASPFVDDDGTKYMYYSGWGASKAGSGSQCIYGVKMKDWLTPDYSTTNVICQTHRRTVGGALVDDEGRQSGAWVNEGPFMIKRNGTYMMTFSIYPYTDINYQVRLATSTKPLSGLTKLDPYNGGTVIKSSMDWDGIVTSVGHHSFITVGKEVYIAYHTFKDRSTILKGRALAIDKVQFVNHNGKEILYTNGPTYGLQALPSEVSGYENVANVNNVSATRTHSSSPELKYLTDGLIQYNDPHDIGTITEDVYFNGSTNSSGVAPSITIDFGNEYKNVRAIMLHFTREYNYRLLKGAITKTTITYKSTNGDKQVVVDDWQFDYTKYNYDITGITYPGGAAILEFAELPVKKIVIEIAGNYNTSTGKYQTFKISEVMVLANKNNTTINGVSDQKIKEKYSYVNAEVPAIKKIYEGETIGSAVANGIQFDTTFGYDLSKDTKTTKSIKTMGPRDQLSYFKGISGDVIYFEGYINVYAPASYMGDKWPKLGLIAKNDQACTFFYIDAANNYSNMAVGYTQSKIGGGDWDWGTTEVVKNAPGIKYKGTGNYVKLAMARVDNFFYFYLDDVLFFSSAEQRGMQDNVDAVYGFLCFNSGMEVKDYSYITDRTAVNNKIEELKLNTPVQVNGAAFGSIEGNSQVQSGVTWDVSMDYTSDNVHYDNRKVTLSKDDGLDNHLFFINENSSRLYVEADFKTTGVIGPENWGKFGIMFRTLDSDKKANGVYFYADAACAKGETSNPADITGNRFGFAQRINDAFSWDVQTGGTYSSSQVHKLAVYRQGSIFKFIVDGTVLFTTTFSLGASVYPAIFSFKIGLEVTNYRITSDTTDPKMQEYYVETSSGDGTQTGLTFGDANLTIKQQGNWSLGVGSGTSTGNGESYTWSTTIGGKNFYFEADIKAGTPINGDKYPKVGLVLRTSTTELFFVIDAINGGNDGSVAYGKNNWVGYGIRNTGNAQVGNWDFSAQFVPVKGMIYTGGNAAKMGIWFDNGSNVYMVVNGQVVMKVTDVPGLSGATVNASVGVMGWGMQFSFENACAKADATSLALLADQFGLTDSANGITVDASTTDWKGTKLNYYEAKATDAVRGFKVSSFMGTNGVYVLYQGVTSTIGTSGVGNGDWWKNLNVEMVFYNSVGVQTVAKANVKKYAENCFVNAFKYVQRSDNMYNVTVELFVPYAAIGYTGSEEYVAGFFAFRPNENEVAAGINGGDNEAWWYGSVHPFNASYSLASTTYKITKDGLVGSKVTVNG